MINVQKNQNIKNNKNKNKQKKMLKLNCFSSVNNKIEIS